VIKLTNVSKEYPRRGYALRDVSFHLKKGEFAFLTGHSGSGKSTTMRLVHMSERPTQGEVRVTGFSSEKVTRRHLWKVRRRVGFVFQDFRLLPGRTALENVAFVLEVTGTPRSAIVPKAQRLLAQVGLSPKAGAFVNELSGGEQQRVAIARALVQDPALVLADEPTGNLDDATGTRVLGLLEEVSRAAGKTLVLVTHSAAVAERADRVLAIEDGHLVPVGG
jgi:cell division transport system ATP-binding protein